MRCKNPLDYIRRAKATADRKKNSLGAIFTYKGAELIVKCFGIKVIHGLLMHYGKAEERLRLTPYFVWINWGLPSKAFQSCKSRLFFESKFSHGSLTREINRQQPHCATECCRTRRCQSQTWSGLSKRLCSMTIHSSTSLSVYLGIHKFRTTFHFIVRYSSANTWLLWLGILQALTVHFQSYVNTMKIVLTVDEAVIPDPYWLLDGLAESLRLIKTAIPATS